MENKREFIQALRWDGRALHLLDQLRLPGEEVWVACPDVESVARGIEDMVVRGAPAIGCTAAYGVAIAARRAADAGEDVGTAVARAVKRLRRTRPTAVNLFWALDRMQGLAIPPGAAGAAALAAEAVRIHEEDVASCRAIGRHGATLFPPEVRVLTHCNTGALATGGYGTALGMVRAAVESGRRVSVFADETRPYLQGARLTAWELMRDGIPVTLIPDNMAGHLMKRREVDVVVVGADRIVRNGDVANKIGTYPLAVLAHAHGVPFYVAAPISTIDLALPSGDHIAIEERSAREVTHIKDVPIAPEGVAVRNYAFDVTPASLIAAIVTERGVARPPYDESLRALVQG